MDGCASGIMTRRRTRICLFGHALIASPDSGNNLRAQASGLAESLWNTRFLITAISRGLEEHRTLPIISSDTIIEPGDRSSVRDGPRHLRRSQRGCDSVILPMGCKMTSSSSDLNLMTPEELRCELLLSRRQVEARSAELAESLEYQAAIANVLDVISRSPNEVQPVFDVIAHTAWKLCDATGATIFMRQADGRYRMVAQEDPVAGTSFGDRLRTMTLAADRSSVTGRAALEGRTVHIEDIRVDSEF